MDSATNLPVMTADWFQDLGPRFARYSSNFARNGFETMFALGLVIDESDLYGCGMWGDDLKELVERLHIPQNLTNHWTPMIADIPTDTTLRMWLGSLPVPGLAPHEKLLSGLGFEKLGSLAHITLDDLRDPETREFSLPTGHALTIAHCAKSLEFASSIPPPPNIPLEVWLGHLNPSLERFEKTLKLAGYTTVEKLMDATKEEIHKLELMKIGYRRVLWHYIVAMRSHWIDPL